MSLLADLSLALMPASVNAETNRLMCGRTSSMSVPIIDRDGCRRRLCFADYRVVVSVSTSRSRDGLETYQRLVSVSSREKLSTSRSRLGLGQLRLVPKTNFRPNCAGHINNTFSYHLSKSCYYHIRELRCLRFYLDFKTASTIATSIVHPKLDYCNSLYYNLPQSQIKNSITSISLLLVLLPERQNLLTSFLF